MKKSNNHSNRITIASLLVALGIIYGDIGTSPLYVLKAIIGDRPMEEGLIYGGVSCVFWTLVLQTSIKYVLLTLMADNDGEGGVFSLYALVRRYRKGLVIPTILGATTLLADGIITPPISVASAVEGLEMVIPDLPTVPIVVAILSVLFFFQRFGTQRVGQTFGPMMVLWFSMLFVLGLKEILKHPEVLKALHPSYAWHLLMEYPQGFWLLGAVFLATTGAEAMYSDLGHCGRKNIRITWMFVKVGLMTNYLGQAAWSVHQGSEFLDGRNPFYEIVPSWFLIPGVAIATMAAIIASQALISGSYTLIAEAMSLNFWPRVTVRQPTELKGQIYIPSVNTILWIGCVLMILYFQSSTHMEAAYGFSITIAMMMTSILLFYFLLYRMKWNPIVVVAIFLLFGTIELSFFITNVAKIKERWMFLFFELFIFLVMYVWYYARKINNRFVRFVELGKYTTLIKELSEDDTIPKFATHLIYLTKANHRDQIEEKTIKSIFSKKPKRADVYWFLHIHLTDEPYTLDYEVTELVDDKVIKVTINLGFRVQPRSELFFKRIVRDLVEQRELNLHIRPDGSTRYNPEPDFKFVVLEKFLSVENEFTLRDGVLLNAYFFIKRFGQSDEKAFGLDKSDVLLEQVPLVYHRAGDVVIERRTTVAKTLLIALITLPLMSLGQRVPFEGIDQTWQNGSDRRDSSVFANNKYFVPTVLIDINYSYSFNNPNDHSVVGSTALARHNEIQLSALHFGGDFSLQNVRARVMTQFGTRSTVVPRNDLSPYRGQSDLATVYRYLSEAYAGYHIDAMYGINVDAGLFMSYIGLNSYYQAENWEYQASFTSDNTPWFFNGIRIQIHPSKNLKIEPWIINGWQSYGKFNSLPGIGGNITYMSSNSNLKLITNNYYGTDAAGIPDRIRFHTDNSVLLRYFNRPERRGISRMAFSLTGDLGFESGGGVNGFDSSDPAKPAQYFLSAMFYNRVWMLKNKIAWTLGGGFMKNPGRYLVLAPTGQASPLPDPLNPTQAAGAYPFTANPGDSFEGWDCSANVDYMPTQHITFRAEWVHRESSVPYFAGHGGVTSPTGFVTTPLDPAWRPDLVKSETKIIFAMLFRL